jgi:cysteinyl-tRNA synthetase
VSLTLYNTAARAKQSFEPLTPGHVRMYVCGPTVYDYAHIGNARSNVAFDVLYRVLRRAFEVTYVRNITDVDDKIIAASAEGGEAIGDITARTTAAFHEDMAALGCAAPDIEPRATAHIPQMIEMIETLIAKGNAYEADGHVLFSVPSMPGYGSLSGRNRDEQIAGARVDVAPYKRDPADFVLWKPSVDDLPGWDSPWGRGRPGWHLECSAMSKEYLGERFDIHGGGQDLIFPHHENEIAQSTCAHGRSLAKFWVHNGYLTVEGEKMSKSLGNVLTVRDLLRRERAELIRLALLATHYRQPLDWTDTGLRSARARINRWYNVLYQLRDVAAKVGDSPPAFVAAMEDDLNTPEALAAIDEMAHSFQDANSGAAKADLKGAMLACGALLGIFQVDPEAWRKGQLVNMAAGPDGATIEAQITARAAARAARNFAEADRIRDALADTGVVLEDSAGGTTWRRD